ncbi:MAG: cytochrome c biogenesis protein CcsA [Flavobacteriales bacterium]|nr:cytochrome c biogenesis protein CcsA [Flavobacteriales bacterium]
MNPLLKIACAVLLLYVVIFSLGVPMNPGLTGTDTRVVKPGTNVIQVDGYRTHFLSEAQSLRVFLEADSVYYCTEATAISDDLLKATVLLPETLNAPILSVYVNNREDGTVYLPLAFRSEGAAISPGSRPTPECKVSVENDQHASFGFPFQPVIFESIRNLMWHVPMWFTMFFLMFISVFQSVLYMLKYQRQSDGLDEAVRGSLVALVHDRKAAAAVSAGMVFCILGLITGSIWARFTWTEWWTNDPQLNGALVVFLLYASYFVLRATIEDEEKRARLSAVYNIFACVMMIVLLMVMPKFVSSLHPGKEGTPAFSTYDLDSSLRLVFYPAVAGWILLGYWFYNLRYRINKLQSEANEIM